MFFVIKKLFFLLIIMTFLQGCTEAPQQSKEFTDEDYRQSIKAHKQWAAEKLAEYCEKNGLSPEEFVGPKIFRGCCAEGIYFLVRYYHPTHYFSYYPDMEYELGRGAGLEAGVKINPKKNYEADCSKTGIIANQDLPGNYYREEAIEAAYKQLVSFSKEHYISVKEFGRAQILESNEDCGFPIYIVSYDHPKYYFHYSLYMNRLWAGKKAGATIDYTDVANLPFITGTLAPKKEPY
jgi:hypothetical protein